MGEKLQPEKKALRCQRILLDLEGYMMGVSIDARLEEEEARTLRHWLLIHNRMLSDPPLEGLARKIRDALSDGQIDRQVWQEVVALCRELSGGSVREPQEPSSELRRLQGMVRGLLADGRISEEEIKGLQAALLEHRQVLEGIWLYDEIAGLVDAVLVERGGPIERDEKERLKAYFEDFTIIPPEAEALDVAWRIGDDLAGVLSRNPRIRIPGFHFAFAGLSAKGSRERVNMAIRTHGGLYQQEVDEGLDYLIVGSNLADRWVRTCFGWKIEQAVRLRESSVFLQLIAEKQFWSSV